MRIATFFMLCLPLAFSTGASAENPKWKIGILAPLSGDVAPWGQDTQRAVELANEMLGQGQFKLIFEDDRSVMDSRSLPATWWDLRLPPSLRLLTRPVPASRRRIAFTNPGSKRHWV